MELKNEFSVKVTVDEAWTVLTDLERIAPCMPGFELRGVDGDEYRGVVRVKVGPMTAQYEGVASFQERDEANHRAVVRAEGRDTRGQGSATATVTATLAPVNGGTHVTLRTDLKISGRVAQFGRGVLADVSSKLLRQFVQALETDVLTGAAIAAIGAIRAEQVDEPTANGPWRATRSEVQDGPPATAASRGLDSASGEPIDLLATAGASVIKRVGPLVVVLIVVLWLLLGR